MYGQSNPTHTCDKINQLVNPLCAVFHQGSLIVGTFSSLVVVDVSTRRVRVAIESDPVTALALWPDLGVCVGTANGVVELRRFETLRLCAVSMEYNAYHSERGSRKSIDEFPDVKQVPHAVQSFDYLESQRLLLSVSNSGQIYLWTGDIFPFAHFTFLFHASAVCFTDDGSILLSAIRSFFMIPSFVLFDMKMEFDDENEVKGKNPPEMFVTKPELIQETLSVRDVIRNVRKSDAVARKPKKEPIKSTWEDLIVE